MDKLFVHIRTKGIYEVLHSGRVKIDGKWKEAIIYKNKDGEVFVRTKVDFDRAFTPFNSMD